MKVNWLIEDYAGDDIVIKLANAARNNGDEVVIAKYLPFQSGKYDVFPDISCTTFYGSIQMALQIQREKTGWIPSVWCNWEEMKCQNYYTKCGELLVNQNYMMMPLAEVSRRSKELFEHFSGSFFVRPDSGGKSFTGMLVHFDNVKDPLWDFVLSETSKETLVVVAPPLNIKKEWRVIIADGQAITGCLYKENGTLNVQEGCDQEVLRLAEFVAHKLKPFDPIFVIDICEHNKELKLLEIGAFSVAGLYALDVEKIATTVHNLAIREYNDIAPSLFSEYTGQATSNDIRGW